MNGYRTKQIDDVPNNDMAVTDQKYIEITIS
jgi:hypothetical protein